MSDGKTLLKGSEIAIKSLELLGVETVFAYPGGQAIEIHQALVRSSLRVVLPRHEQGGAFAAVGYARASGRVGVAMATSGPGATNLVSGIADAYMDSIPTLFITGQVPLKAIGKNAFQETDIIGVTRPIVKHSFLVMDARELAGIMRRAYTLASSGRPGPVVVDIPKNVQQQLCEFDPEELKLIPEASPAPAAEDISAIRKLLARSKRPCVYAGGGVVSAGAAAELRRFVEAWQLPLVTSLLGVGLVPFDYPNFLGWLGMHGAVAANRAIDECDLLIALGTRFSDRSTGNPAKFAVDAKIVHVDIDETEINKNVHVDLGVISDVREVLLRLAADAPKKIGRKEWAARTAELKKKCFFSYPRREGELQPQFVVETLSRLTDRDAVIVPGVGQHQMWASQYYGYKFPRQLLTSGGLGAMGFGLPAAMGAKIACPDRTVVNVDGDGSFQMNIQELGTLAVENIPVKMMIFDNQHLGMVAQWEDRFYNGRRGNTILGRSRGGVGETDFSKPYPDFVKIAAGYDIPGRHVWTAQELPEAIEAMLAADTPYLLDIHIGYREHVLPMIPPGGSSADIITE